MKPVKTPIARGRLLEIAAHIFATEGAGALTVRRLAQDLGTSTMSLYTHFSGKDQLIEATADEFVVRFADALRSVPLTDDPLFDFVCMSHRYRSVSLEHRDLYRVALVSGRLSIAQDTPRGMKGMFDYCVGAVARCRDAGMLKVLDARQGLTIFWTAVHGQVTLEMERVFPSPRSGLRAWEKCLTALLVGQGARRAQVDVVMERARRMSIYPPVAADPVSSFATDAKHGNPRRKPSQSTTPAKGRDR